MITIIDYGAGNIKSIQNMLKKIGVPSKLTSSAKEVIKAEKLILPGVGHFDYGIRQLRQSGLMECLEKRVLEDKAPILGICLGAQMLGNGSEEGSEKGLGWIDMDIVHFDTNRIHKTHKVPNMGWNYINPAKDSALLSRLDQQARFYFVHTYHMHPKRELDVLAYSNYGYEYASAVSKDNIYGVQFHPEKSHKYGMQLLRNFTAI
ncbi:imidazole glycerol phosphate synthase subunit HisH [Vicingaceae bacterium]|nr:imidazole glycerol phosphate synthase subunit HisH [Vicingaceae bacterium]